MVRSGTSGPALTGKGCSEWVYVEDRADGVVWAPRFRRAVLAQARKQHIDADIAVDARGEGALSLSRPPAPRARASCWRHG